MVTKVQILNFKYIVYGFLPQRHVTRGKLLVVHPAVHFHFVSLYNRIDI